MSETKYTRDLMKALRQRLPDAVVLKHCDLYTMGVPDLSVTFEGVTRWFEAKELDREDVTVKVSDIKTSTFVATPFVTVKPAKHVPAIQWETLRRLGRGYLIVYTPSGHTFTAVGEPRGSAASFSLTLFTMVDLANRIVAQVRGGE